MTNDVFTTVTDENDRFIVVNNERILYMRQIAEQEWVVHFDNGHDWKIDNDLAGTIMGQLRFVVRVQAAMPAIGTYPFTPLPPSLMR